MIFLFRECIVCFVNRKPMRDINTKHDDGCLIDTKLKNALPEYGLLESLRYKFICRKCLNDLDRGDKFKKSYIENFTILHEIMQQRLGAATDKACVYSVITLKDISKHNNSRTPQKSSENSNTGHKLDHDIPVDDKINDSTSKTDEITVQKPIRKRHLDQNRYHCTQCGIGFGIREELRRHLRTHKSTGPYLCEYCPYKDTSLEKIKIHAQKIHPREEQIVFNKANVHNIENSSIELTIIKDTVSASEPEKKRFFKCPGCSQLLKSVRGIKDHEMKHGGRNPFVCKICEKTYANRNSFKVHQKVHQNERPFECDICGMRFKRKHGLKMHIITHKSEGLYQDIGEEIVLSVNAKASKNKINIKKETETDALSCGSFETIYLKEHQYESKSSSEDENF